MAVWDWADVPHQQRPLHGGPAQAKLAASLVPGQPPVGADYDELFVQRSGLPLLALAEWRISEEIPSLFKILREAGSSCGFVVEQADGWQPSANYLEIDLDDATATRIAEDFAMDPVMAFADDKGHCALASWWSDVAWIGMVPTLFDRWINLNPLDLTIWADDPVRRIATNLATAQEYARLRELHWNERFPIAPGDSPTGKAPFV